MPKFLFNAEASASAQAGKGRFGETLVSRIRGNAYQCSFTGHSVMTSTLRGRGGLKYLRFADCKYVKFGPSGRVVPKERQILRTA